MKMITKGDIEETVAVLNFQPELIESLRNAMIELGLADRLALKVDTSALDPFRPMPREWTALQVTFFDNGPEPVQKRKRPTLKKTKRQYACEVRCWVDRDVKFSVRQQIAWQAVCNLWSSDEAMTIAREIKQAGMIDAATVEMMSDVIAMAGDAKAAGYEIRLSIPYQAVGHATKWARGHVAVAMMRDGVVQAFQLFRDGGSISVTEFDDHLPNGEALTGNAKKTARVARNNLFEEWATQFV